MPFSAAFVGFYPNGVGLFYKGIPVSRRLLIGATEQGRGSLHVLFKEV